MTGPLQSLKILDFTTLLPGPFATMMLADLGADVIHVEAPQRPDMTRFMQPFDGSDSAWHSALNRNKRSLALNLKVEAGRRIVERLVEKYDIVIEQFRPGVMQRLGVGYEQLQQVNPRLIYCSLTGYGQTGPFRDRAGHDINYLALSGLASYLGRSGQPPVPLPMQVADVGGGSLLTIIAILSAEIHRQQTGEGQYVDVSMFDGSLLWNLLGAAQTLIGDNPPEQEKMTLNGGRYYDYYETSDGRYLSLGALEPKFWQGFCTAIERPDLIEQGLSLDWNVQQQVKAEIAAEIVEQPLAHWQHLFADLDVCVEPVLDTAEALAHPQTVARQMVVDVPKANGGGSQRQIAQPLRFSKTTATYKHTGAALGAHTKAILRESGFDQTEINDMQAAGAFG